MVCQSLHRSETQWALNSAPRAGEWKSPDQVSSRGSLRGSPGWQFRRLQWDVSLPTVLMRWRILDHPRGWAEVQNGCSSGGQEPFFIPGGSTLRCFSAKLWVNFSSHSTSNKTAGNITQSNPGLVLWLLVFPCHKLQFPQQGSFSHFRAGLCCAFPLYSPSNPRNLKLKCLVCRDRSYYCF